MNASVTSRHGIGASAEWVKVAVIFEGQELTFFGHSINDHIVSRMRKSGKLYEQNVLEYLRWLASKLPPRRTFVDVGAFIGTHSIFFAQFCAAGHVLAFEPNPQSYDLLKKNIAVNGQEGTVIAQPIALGARSGRGELLEPVLGNAGTTAVKDALTANDNTGIVIGTLDSVLADRDDIGLIKIDVEGSEIAVLEGGRHVIAKSRPILSIEVHSPLHLLRVFRMLRKDDYIVADCLGASPNYILVSRGRGWFRQVTNHVAWLLWACLQNSHRLFYRGFYRIARLTGEQLPHGSDAL